MLIMSDREQVLDTVQKMPEDASFAQIVDRLNLLAAVREGLEQSDRGEGTPAEEVRDKMRAWALS
jgi:predicted transcriptional regulator